ncbi:cysteine peptidase family C39 domain-containing protein [Microbulbifer bruguierae]|uniref:cysteine peptidase family C39 domain-containing protein n=1 Tax=Microbulbifer bruguierae TaxID=3029061 RepID=UPI0038993415
MRWIGQKNPGENGLLCVASLLSYHNVKYNIKKFRKLYPQFSEGITLRGLMDLLLVHGIQSRPLSCPAQEIDKLKRPCILHWNMHQFVVLTEINEDIFHIYDPASRRSLYTREDFECNFSEVALEIYSKPQYKEDP